MTQAEDVVVDIFDAGDYQCLLLQDGNVQIASYDGNATEVVVPASLDGKQVVGIDSYAFSQCEELTSITLPDSLRSIGSNPFLHCTHLREIHVSLENPTLAVIDGVLFSKTDRRLVYYPQWKQETSYTVPQGIRCIGEGAFSNCSALVSITVPNSVTTIENDAFAECSALISISLPDSVTSIGVGNPFAGCSSLRSIQVSLEQPALAVIDGVLFSKADKRLVCYPQGKTETSYSVPNGIQQIGDEAFQACSMLQEIILPDSVRSIGIEAFSYCGALREITLPESVTSIGVQAFYMCRALESMVVPSGVTTIGSGMFFGCEALKSVALPAGIEVIEEFAFSQCAALPEIILPEGIREIGMAAFSDCTALREITLPASVEYIGMQAFSNCAPSLLVTIFRHSPAVNYVKENNVNYTYYDLYDWLSD